VITADETLIGEAVVLDTASATLGARAAGALLDVVVLFGLWLGTFTWIVAPLMEVLDYTAWSALAFTHAIMMFVGVPVALETFSKGRSVGKWALGLRIVRDDGGPIGFRQAVTRGTVGFLELWVTAGGIALLTSAMNQRGKRMGDMLAGTYALQVRASKSQHSPLHMPPSLATWAQNLDIRRLPDGLALQIRQFLTRAPKLHPASRQDLGLSLASQLSAYVSPQPPPGTHPEAMMMAVLTVRRDREYALAISNTQSDSNQAARIHRLPLGVPDSP
jgi:uncharacterized RDD family membrane protein YckC